MPSPVAPLDPDGPGLLTGAATGAAPGASPLPNAIVPKIGSAGASAVLPEATIAIDHAPSAVAGA